MPIKTTDDRERFDKILKDMSKLDSSFVTIGVNTKEGEQVHPGNISDGRGNDASNTTVAEVAFYNEFGTARIPQRSFIRSTVDEKRISFESLRNDLLNKIIVGRMSVTKGLTALGFRIQQEIRNKIITMKTPPNKPSTVKAKGFNNPLIDSERLLNSITFKVED